MAHFTPSIRSNILVPPSATAQQSGQASATHSGGNDAAALPASPNAVADPARLQLLNFANQARVRAAKLRAQLQEGPLQFNGILHEGELVLPNKILEMLKTIPDRIDAAVDGALHAANQPILTDPEARVAETKRICFAKLHAIPQLTTDNDAGALQNLFALSSTQDSTAMSITELADYRSAETLNSDLKFLAENSDLWLDAPEIDEQTRHYCYSLIIKLLGTTNWK